MAKAGDLLKSALIKADTYRSDFASLITKLNETEVSFPEDAATALKTLDTRVNIEKTHDLGYEAEKKIKTAARVEVYDKMDKIIGNFASLLDGEAKTKYDSLGDKATAERTKFILDHFQERSSKSENASEDSKTFKKNLEELQAKIGTDYVPKSEFDSISDNLNGYKERLLNNNILTAARFHKDVADSVKGERWFPDLILSDTKKYIDSKGWEIDSESGKIRGKGKEDYELKEGTSEAMNLNDLITQVVSKHENYQKKSDGSSSDGTYVSDAGKETGGISAEQKAHIDRMNAY